jgi:hypothetical protein
VPEVWPSDLPKCFILGSEQEQPGDMRLRSAPDVGPAKQRPRSTAAVDLLSGSMKLTEAQWEILKAFGKTTLAGWSLPFLFPDADGRLARFGESVPSATKVAGTVRTIQMQLEILP